jgi:hypothetical protein
VTKVRFLFSVLASGETRTYSGKAIAMPVSTASNALHSAPPEREEVRYCARFSVDGSEGSWRITRYYGSRDPIATYGKTPNKPSVEA